MYAAFTASRDSFRVEGEQGSRVNHPTSMNEFPHPDVYEYADREHCHDQV